MNLASDSLALSMRHVRKSFGSREVLKNLHLQVPAGTCLGLLGPNGAGKTTTLRIAQGLAAADSGEVTLLGYRLPQEGSAARARIGVVPQADALDPDFTVAENLRVFARYFGLSTELVQPRIAYLLDFAALTQRADDKVTALSGGLKRRLTLARALINEPDCIFLDEPTTALDPQARHLIWERLQALREQGKTLILTTHFMEEAQRLCDEIAIMDDGEIRAQGRPAALIQSTIACREVLELFGRLSEQWLQSMRQNHPQLLGLDKQQIEQRGDTVFIYSNDLHPWLQLLHHAQEDQRPDYLLRPANLEDVFLRLTGRDLRD